MRYLKDRLREPSTWRGIVLLVGALSGIAIDEQQLQFALLIVGALGVLSPER